MKFYQNISSIRSMEVKIIGDDEVLYEGNVDNAPAEIKSMRYYNIELGNQANIYVTKKEIN